MWVPNRDTNLSPCEQGNLEDVWLQYNHFYRHFVLVNIESIKYCLYDFLNSFRATVKQIALKGELFSHHFL